MKTQKYQTKERKTRWSSIFLTGLVASGMMMPATQVLAVDRTWGPERPTFSWDVPASYRTFNSIENNPTIGDERNFVRVREAGVGNYTDNVTVSAGKEYEVYVYYHNNASAHLNASGQGIADNVRLSMLIPEKLTKTDSGIIKGTITSTNSNPTSVYDMAFLNATETVYMRYVANSAVIHNDGTANGEILSGDALFSDQGALLAHWKEDWGLIPGCNEYAGYVVFRLKADQPGFFIEKTASTAGANQYGEQVKTTPGSEIDFKITYTNTGTTVQKNVTVYDQMPEGMEYIPGTTFVKTPAVPNGEFVVDKLFNGGLVIGDFAAGEKAEITYKGKLSEDKDKFPCGQTVIYNNSSVATANGTQYDKVKITVERVCEGTPSELPETGPAEIVMAVIVIAGIGIGGAYWVRSRIQLKKLEKGE